AIPEIEIDLVEALAADIGGDRGIVDETVDLALARADIAAERLDRRGLVEVDQHKTRRRHFAELLGDRAPAVFHDVAEHETGARLGAGTRDRPPHAARGTRDDDRAPGQHSIRPRCVLRPAPRPRVAVSRVATTCAACARRRRRAGRASPAYAHRRGYW